MAHHHVDAKDAIRELHVLYGIAQQTKLAQPTHVDKVIYSRIAKDLHASMTLIASGWDAEKNVGELVRGWERMADPDRLPTWQPDVDDKKRSVYSSWASTLRIALLVNS